MTTKAEKLPKTKTDISKKFPEEKFWELNNITPSIKFYEQSLKDVQEYLLNLNLINTTNLPLTIDDQFFFYGYFNIVFKDAIANMGGDYKALQFTAERMKYERLLVMKANEIGQRLLRCSS